MRLWHIELIKVLPRQQLLGQWRELNSIFKNQNKHILINFVYEYSKEDLLQYSYYILDEMEKRGYKFNTKNFDVYFEYTFVTKEFKCFENKMNERYLKQCLYNLQEKFDCGGITKDEWDKIYNKFKNYIDY